jgi:hypothetical protein
MFSNRFIELGIKNKEKEIGDSVKKNRTTRVDGNQKVIMRMMRLSLKQFNRHSRSQTTTQKHLSHVFC